MPKRLCIAVFCASLLFGWVCLGNPQDGTLIGTFESGRAAFLSQNYAEAVALFQSIETDFASEPEFSEPTFVRYYFSMYGMSALLSGDVSLAESKLSAYIQRFYERKEKDAVILLALIQVCRQLENNQKLDTYYQTFFHDFQNHPDYDALRFEYMLVLFDRGDVEKGLLEMDRIWNSSAPQDLKQRARLIGIQQYMNADLAGAAGTLLLNTNWDISSMPEMAVLATSALRIGEYFMSKEAWDNAIQAFRWVPFYEALLETQRRRLKGLQTSVENFRKTEETMQSPVWLKHYEALVSQVSLQLEQLEKTEDYTPAFLLKYGRCYLFQSQYAEAWVVFRCLALSEGLDDTIVEQAWYHWILASHGAENWDEARSLCLQFAERFPDSLLLPKTFFMLARTFQDTSDFDRANTVLTDLINRFPDNEDSPEWMITRGFNKASLNDNEAALRDFECALQHPKISRALKIRGSCLMGVTLSALDRFDESIEVFRQLIKEYPDHWMFPEFQYRLATVYYSKRDYVAAEKQLVSYIADNPDHFYIPEAKVLLGDVAMGKGELDRAIELFSGIEPGDPGLYMYAYFQIGKIYRAREQYPEMEQHFREYLNGTAFRGKGRTSEALYWLGWALTQQKREPESIPLYLGAIVTYGNDIHSGEVISILQALEVLKKKLPRMTDSNPFTAEDLQVKQFHDMPDFQSWLIEKLQSAKTDKQYTLYARLQLYEAMKLRNSKREELARSAIKGISLVSPLESLDDQLLGEIGLSLVEDGFDAGLDYLKRLLILFPKSPSKALAYYGFAFDSTNRSQCEDALRWLNLFEKETPSHPKIFEAMLLKGKTLTMLGRYEHAEQTYDELLKLKSARGVTHVKALMGLAEMNEHRNDYKQAIAYYQRIYTLYRAFRPFVAQAYWKSANFFESIGDARAAYRSLIEFSLQNDLSEFPEYKLVEAKIQQLENQYGPALNHPDPDEESKSSQVKPEGGSV